jgi:uncharacterized protein (TIGR00251 family)
VRFRAIVKTNQQANQVLWSGAELVCRVTSPPISGQANEQLVNVVATMFGLPKTNVVILQGHTTRYKTLEIAAPKEHIDAVLMELPRIPRQMEML